MTDWKPKKCKDCGARVVDGAIVSRRGLCSDCGPRRQAAALAELRAHSGPAWDALVAGMIAKTSAAGVGGVGGTPDAEHDATANETAAN